MDDHGALVGLVGPSDSKTYRMPKSSKHLEKICEETFWALLEDLPEASGAVLKAS